jgi:hypothetical protein
MVTTIGWLALFFTLPYFLKDSRPCHLSQYVEHPMRRNPSSPDDALHNLMGY